MKPIWIMIMVIGAAAAGGAGGFIATTLAGPAQPNGPRIAEAPAENLPDPDFDTTTQLESAVEWLRRDFERVSRRIQDLESRGEAPDLSDDLEKLKTRISELEAKRVNVSNSQDGPVPDNYLRAAVEAAIEQREAEEQERQQAAREQAMTEARQRQRTAIVNRLVESLTLTTAQQSKVDTVVADYLEKRGEVWTRSMEARRSGTTFDMRAEMQTVEQTAQAAVRNELLGGQLQTFNELVGDNGLSSLAPGGNWGGMAPGRGRPANREGNREGNRRNNND